MKKVKIRFLGNLEGKAVAFPFLDAKIEKKMKIGFLSHRESENERDRMRDIFGSS